MKNFQCSIEWFALDFLSFFTIWRQIDLSPKWSTPDVSVPSISNSAPWFTALITQVCEMIYCYVDKSSCPETCSCVLCLPVHCTVNPSLSDDFLLFSQMFMSWNLLLCFMSGQFAALITQVCQMISYYFEKSCLETCSCLVYVHLFIDIWLLWHDYWCDLVLGVD